MASPLYSKNSSFQHCALKYATVKFDKKQDVDNKLLRLVLGRNFLSKPVLDKLSLSTYLQYDSIYYLLISIFNITMACSLNPKHFISTLCAKVCNNEL